VEIFEKVVDQYPNTESEIGALSNMGICYEELSRFQDAIKVYEKVMQKYEDGLGVSYEAFKFAQMHKDYIVANRL
jgi:tetratricopeptide (TPR) repeat protein